MRTFILLLIGLSLSLITYAQTLPANRAVDWTIAGLNDTSTVGFTVIDMAAAGLVGDGATANDADMTTVLAGISGPGAILEFPAGNFLFNQTLNLPSNIVLKGEGAEMTTLSFDLGGSGDAINVSGSDVNSVSSTLTASAFKNDFIIEVADGSIFQIGDWIRTIQDDENLMTSTWAYNTYGQITEITAINNNELTLRSALRLDLDLANSPYIIKMTPKENVGIECLKIHRLDDTAPEQSASIEFRRVVNSWVKGIESENCTFSHIDIRLSSNINVSKSYMHHAFDYGGGGRAYGVMLHSTTNECLIEDNVFEYLRHSMIVQSGANGNVFAYNYSFDPYWDSFPSNSAGDMVLHGNYPFYNLFEQNICQNIVIDNSHGPNGPHNTFLRNRGEGYGIFFSASNSPNQNFLGNEITNTSFPYNIANYSINGTGHFIHGNNNKGTIDPAGTEVLPDESYAFTSTPNYVPASQWAGIGMPNVMEANSIPARDRLLNNDIFLNACIDPPTDHVIQAKLFLQAAYDGSIMTTDLLANNLIPLAQPFNTAPWNYSGSESVSNIPNDVTDWILLELRDANDLNTVAAQQAAFLRKDGSVIALDGSVGLSFSNLNNNSNYRLIIRSRNHLAVVSNNEITLPQTSFYDFTSVSNIMGGNTQVTDLGGGVYGLYAGDIYSEGVFTVIDFNEFVNDSSNILEYKDTDVNLDGYTTVEDYNWYRQNNSLIGITLVQY